MTDTKILQRNIIMVNLFSYFETKHSCTGNSL